jgi:hypothetical protein
VCVPFLSIPNNFFASFLRDLWKSSIVPFRCFHNWVLMKSPQSRRFSAHLDENWTDRDLFTSFSQPDFHSRNRNLLFSCDSNKIVIVAYRSIVAELEEQEERHNRKRYLGCVPLSCTLFSLVEFFIPKSHKKIFDTFPGVQK